MTKDEQERISLMLAFLSMIVQDKNAEPSADVSKILHLAQLINEFCDLHVGQSFSAETIKLVDDKGAEQLDAAINDHINELVKTETTRLPEDRETLVKFYDRLLQRKTRRSQWVFYAKATEAQLADAVLHMLDEEIDERHGAQ